MERLSHLQFSFIQFSTVIIASGAVSFSLCIAAEFKKSKRNDVRIEGKQCSVPKSEAFGLGIAALVCLCVAQIIGNFFIWKKFRSREDGHGCTVRQPTVSCSLIILAWICFVLAVILIGAATSMSQAQPFGEGWLDGDCYLIKNGVYAGSAVLGLAALGLTLGSGAVGFRQRKVEEHRKVHAQVVPSTPK